MKMNKFALIALTALLSLTSCLKDQADVFEQPASQRMTDYLADVRSLLKGSEKGWLLSYCPGKSDPTSYFVLNFTDQKVTAIHQNKPETSATSTYALVTDDGAVLTFDTYNTVLHYYATPDSRHYQARGGDFEFDILDVTDDRITLRGKRSRNYCFLDRLTSDGVEFLRDIVAAEARLTISAFSGEVTGGLVEGYMDPGNHTLTIGRKGADVEEQISARYMVTKNGILFNRPFTLQGVTFSEFIFDPVAETFTASDIVFQKMIPDGWISYDDYVGNYTLSYGGGRGSYQVSLAVADQGASFYLKGVGKNFDIFVTYSGGRGRLGIVKQIVGKWGAYDVMLAPWDSEQGYYTWMDDVGVIGLVDDNSVDNFVIRFEDNGVWGNYNVNAWLVVPSQGGTPNSDLDVSAEWQFTHGSDQLPGPITMTKIPE